MAKIITIAVIKGGTAKTATCATLAQAAAHEGKRVLCIDLDAQANLTMRLKADTNAPGALELLGGAPAKDLIQETEQGIDVIASSIDLASLKEGADSSIYMLSEAIAPIARKYDYIFIDTPPRLNITTYNALQASNGLLIPLEADPDSLQGMYQIIDIANIIKSSNPKLKILGCCITRYNKRAKLTQFFRNLIEKAGKENGCKLIAEIRQGIALQEAQALKVSLYDYAPKSKPAIDYMSLYKTISK